MTLLLTMLNFWPVLSFGSFEFPELGLTASDTGNCPRFAPTPRKRVPMFAPWVTFPAPKTGTPQHGDPPAGWGVRVPTEEGRVTKILQCPLKDTPPAGIRDADKQELSRIAITP